MYDEREHEHEHRSSVPINDEDSTGSVTDMAINHVWVNIRLRNFLHLLQKAYSPFSLDQSINQFEGLLK